MHSESKMRLIFYLVFHYLRPCELMGALSTAALHLPFRTSSLQTDASHHLYACPLCLLYGTSLQQLELQKNIVTYPYQKLVAKKFGRNAFTLVRYRQKTMSIISPCLHIVRLCETCVYFAFYYSSISTTIANTHSNTNKKQREREQ